MTRCKLTIATLGAIMLLDALVGHASARQLASSSSTFRARFVGFRFGGTSGNLTCALTLEGSLHSRTITKTLNSLIGYITAANLGACAEGTATILRETLPWHAQYAGFNGTLPNITSVRINIIGFRFQMREPAFTCLATSTAEAPATSTFDRNVTTRVIDTGEIGGSGIETTCGRVGAFSSDRGPVTVAGSTTRITVTLI